MQPIYTATNVTPAYQLNWSVSLFGKHSLTSHLASVDQLREQTELDGVRILEFRMVQPTVAQFFVSTQPSLSPSAIVRSLKGRWQYLIRSECSKAFRRNYQVVSIGDANAQALENYVGQQTAKHTMADPQVQRRLEALQFCDPQVELGAVRYSHYGRFIYNLQVVLESAEFLHVVQQDELSSMREAIVRTSRKKQWSLSRIGLLSNHVHCLVGAGVKETPESIALSLMNNISWVQGMSAVLRYSYYAGTFGPYNRAAVRRNL